MTASLGADGMAAAGFFAAGLRFAGAADLAGAATFAGADVFVDAGRRVAGAGMYSLQKSMLSVVARTRFECCDREQITAENG